MLKKEIEKIEKKIKALNSEIYEWEKYNKIENDILRDEVISLEKYLQKLQHSNKLITVDEIREMIANASDEKLKLILSSVFEENYEENAQFSNSVFASIHVLENMSDGDEYVMTKVYSDIYKLLIN